MPDYNRVKIGSVYLTIDGLVSGIPCKVEVPELLRLKNVKTGAVQRSADGTPYHFTLDNTGAGVDVSVRPFLIMKTVFDSVVTVINTALSAGTTILVEVDGDFGNFDITCRPRVPDPIQGPGTFVSQRFNDIVFNFVVESFTVS